MRHGSLFSGIGGFDLAASWMQWKNVFSCENDSFCNRILKYYWPETKHHEDIRDFDARIYRNSIDIITGGFPCQPFSVAGNRKGTNDVRFLWPEMLRVIDEIKPRWIVTENVLGFVNWQQGMAFEKAQSDLENQGYEVQSYVLPASGVGAPHKRNRIWIIAFANGHRCPRNEISQECDCKGIRKRLEKGNVFKPLFADGHVADAGPVLLPNRLQIDPAGKSRIAWKKFPTQSPVYSGNDGFSPGLDDLSVSKWRQQSVKSFGNAIVPELAYQIFSAIQQTEKDKVELYRNQEYDHR